MKQAIAIKENYDLGNVKSVIAMADVLKDHIVNQNLYTPISQKNYAHVEGWQFAGGLLGLMPIVTSVEDLSKTGEMKWKATVEIVNQKTDKVVGRGFAICSNKENRKKSFDEYAILSMAQTRAIGKGYRNLIGWVMKAAGYEGTPSEEMTKVGETPKNAEATVSYDDDAPTFVCAKCSTPVSEQEAAYSKRMYGKVLCRDHQAKAKSVLAAKNKK